MYGQPVQNTNVHASGAVYYAQPAPPSWIDVDPVQQRRQGSFGSGDDVFSGMGQWNNDQQMHQGTSGSSGYGSESSTSPPMEYEFHDQWLMSNEPVCLQNIKNLSFREVRQLLKSWTLTREQQISAGYPSFDQYGRIIIMPTIYERHYRVWIDENEPTRRCSRCSQVFEVLANGNFPAGRGVCQPTSSKERPANQHVTNQRFTSELCKFVPTPVPFGIGDSRSGEIYSIDAEMVLTTSGPALARVSVVRFDGHLEMDVVIKPEARVIDTLTKYSGITIGMLERATHTVETVRDLLFELINADTILIGHGLASDLKALRIVHHNVVDTAVLFQDEGKNPIALRTLTKQLLNRSIQQDNSSTVGHNPEEDAVACLDLVKYKINYGY